MKRILFVIFFWATIASAHEMRPAYLEILQTANETYALTWKVPAKSPELRLGLHVQLPDSSQFVSATRSRYAGGAIIDTSVIKRPGGLDDAEIYIEGLSTTFTDVLVRLVRLDGTTQVVRLTPDKPSFTVSSVPRSMEVAKTYTVLGIQHIWEGIDHLIFLLCLMMVAGGGWKLIVTITGFSVAHSITLALSTLDLVRIAVPPVEAVIALSIVFLAVEIASNDRTTLTWRRPVIVSASFGLLHGFGFASVLREIGLPQTELGTALLFFNVGVEIGQLVFIACMFLLALAGKKCLAMFTTYLQPGLFSYASLQKRTSYVIGTVATFWMLERIAGF